MIGQQALKISGTTPCTLLCGASARKNIAPVTGLGHPRATKLYGKDLLAEFRLCRDSITTLRNYAMQIDECLQRRHGGWPKRPKMPRRPSAPTDGKRAKQ